MDNNPTARVLLAQLRRANEELERAAALAGKVQDEMGLEIERLRQENARISARLGEALQVIADGVGVSERLRLELAEANANKQQHAEEAHVYFNALLDLEEGAEQQSQSHTDVLVRIRNAYTQAKERVAAIRSAALAPRGEDKEGDK